MSDGKRIVGVVGASARAAVHSLGRAGFNAWAVDLFTDRDLFVPSARPGPGRYPLDLPALAVGFPPGPVVYTGGLENYPTVLADLAESRVLWGNPPAVLERVRDPLFPGEVWESAKGDALRVPRTFVEGLRPANGLWLRKSRRGAGGDGIYPHTAAQHPIREHEHVQEFVPGQAMSAVFVAGRKFRPVRWRSAVITFPGLSRLCGSKICLISRNTR